MGVLSISLPTYRGESPLLAEYQGRRQWGPKGLLFTDLWQLPQNQSGHSVESLTQAQDGLELDSKETSQCFRSLAF